MGSDKAPQGERPVSEVAVFKTCSKRQGIPIYLRFWSEMKAGLISSLNSNKAS